MKMLSYQFGFITHLFDDFEVEVSCSHNSNEDEMWVESVKSIPSSKGGDELCLDNIYYKNKDGSLTSLYDILRERGYAELDSLP